MSDLAAVMRISLPDATHAMKRVASDIRGEESDRRDVGVSFEWDDARYQFDVSTYSKLLHILNRSDDPEVLGPPLVHSRILSDAILRSRSRVEAMDPRKQRKYLGSGGTLLALLNDLLEPATRARRAVCWSTDLLREFAPGLEALTCGQSITAAALSQGGDVRAKLSRSRAFVECATFKAPLRGRCARQHAGAHSIEQQPRFDVWRHGRVSRIVERAGLVAKTTVTGVKPGVSAANISTTKIRPVQALVLQTGAKALTPGFVEFQLPLPASSLLK